MTREATLCPNCGSHRHRECCARCGSIIRYKRRQGTQFCTDRCERKQQEVDAASAIMEREEQEPRYQEYRDQLREDLVK